ncbi:MAG: alpha-amylase family glycosyl hydrolase [Erysipelotrichaceae bacterium]|nr:alpha-amylase family glycosyl hydrolase [Erysipelotrichaceae bacterium]
MAWYNEAVFYHIYPLGMLNAPKVNDYKTLEHRLNNLIPWIKHLREEGFNALYIGPLFESVGHGYETTDYKKLDNRLGTNEDLKNFVKECHNNDIKVIFDGVFNHTGRDFFAFKDLKKNRENSRYKDWYCNVNFWSNNSYNDGFSYENWGGYDLLVKLNQRNSEVVNYITDVIRYWVSEFDVDGIRLDAADVLDFNFMKELRKTAEEVKEDFWLMGEVIHGDYARWVNDSTLHSVTNYQLHKALFSGMNDHNFFEIAHTVNRLSQIGNLDLYNFVDNHDVERIITKLNNKEHFLPVHIMLYTLPGVPSVYYGSELGIEGHKYRGGTDDDIRPYIEIEKYQNAVNDNYYAQIIALLGNLRKENPVLSYGSYKQVELQTAYYSYFRELDNEKIMVCVSNSNDEHDFYFDTNDTYIGLFSNEEYIPDNNQLRVHLKGNSGEILLKKGTDYKKIEIKLPEPVKEVIKEELKKDFTVCNKNYEDMSIEELQDAILAKMAKNGPITEGMLKSVRENVYHNSLINWVKSFR